MKTYRLCGILGTAALGTLLVSPAQAEETTHGSFGISVVVPAHCEIDSDALVVNEGDGYQFGSVLESCNTPDGFQVAASYRELAAAEHVSFNYAGTSRQLNASGWTPVANRVGAKYGVRPIGVYYTALQAPLAINLTITYL